MPQNLKSRFHIQQLFSGKRSIVLMEITFLYIFNLINHILKNELRHQSRFRPHSL